MKPPEFDGLLGDLTEPLRRLHGRPPWCCCSVRSGGHELAVVGLRSDGRVGHELANLLSTAAGDGDLGSPLQRLLA